MSEQTVPPTISRRAGFPWGRWGLRYTALAYLFLMLVVPILVVVRDGLREGFGGFWHQITQPVALHALWLTLWTALLMTLINSVMGLLTAFVLVRYTFPGKHLLNAIVDLPLSIPSLVTGVMLVVLFGPQAVLGAWLKDTFGITILFAPPGILLALLFITFPFVVRTVQPVMQNLDLAQENAAAILGASPWTIFQRILFPYLRLPLLTGALLTFARALGEFGAIVIVAGNIPFYSQTAAVFVFGEMESENRIGASVISIVMIALALGMILLVNALETRANEGER